MASHRELAWIGAVVAALLAGCAKQPEPLVVEKDYGRALPPGASALAPVRDPAEIPDFTSALRDTANLRLALANSLNYLSKPSSLQFFPISGITHQRVVASLEAFDALLASGAGPKELAAAIRRDFDVYTSVGCDGQGTVLFTGYYTPIFDASLTPGGRFRHPLYRRPDDLMKSDDGKILGRRTDSGIEPYPTRAQIESSGMLAGQELVYLADPFEAYMAHVQGSVKLRLTDGRLVTAGYAASNGRQYRSVGMVMVADGKIPAQRLSVQEMTRHFNDHPDQLASYLSQNPRYVFFAFQDDPTPRGSINEPVIAYRSIATDKSIFPRAGLAFIKTELPRRVASGITALPFEGFVLDQDAGGAIRAPGRCDVYMGMGIEAGRLAGRTKQEGRLYYLLLKSKR